MSRRPKRGRPADPIDIARRRAEQRALERDIDLDPSRWGVAREPLALPANAAVEVRSEPGAGKIRARRQDVFDLMRARGKLSMGAFEAVRRLQSDLAVLHRTIAGGGGYAPKIDHARRPTAFSDARLRAGERIEAVLSLAGPVSARLLGALCEADAVLGGSREWRSLVSRETGETLPDAQAAVLRAACENLAGAYALMDRGRRPRQ